MPPMFFGATQRATRALNEKSGNLRQRFSREAIRRRIAEAAGEVVYQLTPIAIFDRIFDAYHHIWWKRGRKRARRDPRWAEIEQLREEHSRPGAMAFLNADAGLTMDLWEEQHDIFNRVNPHTWMHKLHWWLGRHRKVAHPIRGAKEFIQRGRRGYADRDIWGFDTYLAGVIADGVAQLRETFHGHPVGVTEEEWGEILTKIEEGFRAYLTLDDVELTPEEQFIAEAKVDEAFDLFGAWYGALWD